MHHKYFDYPAGASVYMCVCAFDSHKWNASFFCSFSLYDLPPVLMCNLNGTGVDCI